MIKSINLGVGKNILKGQVWEDSVSTYTSEARKTVITAKDGSSCVPVSEVVYGSDLMKQNGTTLKFSLNILYKSYRFALSEIRQ